MRYEKQDYWSLSSCPLFGHQVNKCISHHVTLLMIKPLVFHHQKAPTGHGYGSDSNALYHLACWLGRAGILAF